MLVENQDKNLRMAWLVWGLAALFYFSDYMARVAPGVMHQSLQQAFGINETGFATLTASFYFPYVLMQIPVGLMTDRLSIRRLLTIMSLITAIGCVVFASANGLGTAAMARMLIGFSAAFAFVCSLRLATSWFPASMLGLLAGFTQALGMLGAASGEAPVSFLVGAVGWRNSLLVMASCFVLLSLLLYRFVRDTPNCVTNAVATKKIVELSIWKSLAKVASHRQAWINALYAGFVFVPTAVIGESIGPAYLQFGRGLSAHQAAFATGLIFIGWGLGGPLSGYLSDKIGKRKPVMLGSALMGILLSSLFIFMPNLTPSIAYMIFFLFGLTNTGVAIAYAVCTEIQEKSVVGTMIGFTNMASILVGALAQPLVGHLVDLSAGARSYHVETLLLQDFQAGLWILPAASVIALILAAMVRETYCKAITPN